MTPEKPRPSPTILCVDDLADNVFRLLMLSEFPDVPSTARDSVDAFALKGANPAGFREMLESLIPPSQKGTPATDAQTQNMELRRKSQELLDAARRLKEEMSCERFVASSPWLLPTGYAALGSSIAEDE